MYFCSNHLSSKIKSQHCITEMFTLWRRVVKVTTCTSREGGGWELAKLPSTALVDTTKIREITTVRSVFVHDRTSKFMFHLHPWQTSANKIILSLYI